MRAHRAILPDLFLYELHGGGLIREQLEEVENGKSFSGFLYHDYLPIQLLNWLQSKKGKKISEQLEAKNWVPSIADELYGKAFGKQEQLIAEVSYQNAVTRESLLSALVVELRDCLLTMHGISNPQD
ncbi:MAG: hypothetical protein OXC42_06755 [Gammaproteobacteria bacterium]|nr:hypothetical protein [Gammaproteobacteria bacterium]